MNTNKFMILIIVLVTLLTSSCQIPRTSRFSENQVQLVQYSLKEADLPGSGWSIEGQGWNTDYGGESYGITYIRDKHVFVNHIVSIHSNVDQAKQAYVEWEVKWFDVTNLQPEVPYVPSSQDDDYRFECFQMKPNDPLLVCFYLQRHNQVINFVRISLDGKSKDNLTFEEINNILGILDKRLNEVVLDAKPEGNTP